MPEPIYCQGCGDEIGPEHRGDCDFYEQLERGARPRANFCAVCSCAEPCGCEWSEDTSARGERVVGNGYANQGQEQTLGVLVS